MGFFYAIRRVLNVFKLNFNRVEVLEAIERFSLTPAFIIVLKGPGAALNEHNV